MVIDCHKSESTTDLRVHAFHEAGHFVASIYYPNAVQYDVITIDPFHPVLLELNDGVAPGKTVAGACIETDLFNNDLDIETISTTEDIIHDFIVTISGYLSELTLFSKHMDDSFIRSASDFEELEPLRLKLGFPQIAEVTPVSFCELELYLLAHKFLEEHWKEVEALANELIRHKTIDADQASWVMAIARGESGSSSQDPLST